MTGFLGFHYTGCLKGIRDPCNWLFINSWTTRGPFFIAQFFTLFLATSGYQWLEINHHLIGPPCLDWIWTMPWQQLVQDSSWGWCSVIWHQDASSTAASNIPMLMATLMTQTMQVTTMRSCCWFNSGWFRGTAADAVGPVGPKCIKWFCCFRFGTTL